MANINNCGYSISSLNPNCFLKFCPKEAYPFTQQPSGQTIATGDANGMGQAAGKPKCSPCCIPEELFLGVYLSCWLRRPPGRTLLYAWNLQRHRKEVCLLFHSFACVFVVMIICPPQLQTAEWKKVYR